MRENIKDGHTSLLSSSKTSSKRKYKVAWCLYQAIKIRDIAALRHARMICLFRDERKTRLAVSARLVAADLVTTALSFGHMRDTGTGAKHVTLATYNILKDTLNVSHR